MPNDSKPTQDSDVGSSLSSNLEADQHSSQISRMREFSSELDRLMRKQFYFIDDSGRIFE